MIVFNLPMLPTELLIQVINQLVLLYLAHPRKVCWDLDKVLSLRLVNRKATPIL